MNSHKLVQFGNLEVNIVCISMCDILFSGCLGMQIVDIWLTQKALQLHVVDKHHLLQASC